MLGIIGLLGLAIVGLVFLPVPRPEDDGTADAAADDAEGLDWSDHETGELLALAGHGARPGGAFAPGPGDAATRSAPASGDEVTGAIGAPFAAPDAGDRLVDAVQEVADAGGGPLVIEDYARQSDALVLLYDSAGAAPEVTWDKIGAGVRVFADGAQVALIKGLERIDPADLSLVAE